MKLPDNPRDLTPEQKFAGAQMARHDFYFFCRWMFWRMRGFKWSQADHHPILCDALTRVFNGECTRLIINIPPRYSKTEIAVVNFIAWSMGKVPDSEFLHLSYSSDLASKNSYNVKSIIQHEAYREIFDVSFATDASAHWRTKEGGVVYTAGLGGTLTGFGAGKEREGFGGGILIDDPHKADEAKSDTIRAGVIDSFKTTVESRKNSVQTPIVLIMQRLHEEDLSGWLLGNRKDGVPVEGGNGEVWEHICLPAIQRDAFGNEKALWPKKHSLQKLKAMERAAPYVFAGQYMQRPAPLEGGMFKPDMMPVFDAIPAENIRWVRGWDFGATTNGDMTAGLRLGKTMTSPARFIISDVSSMQLGPHERDTSIKNIASADGRKVAISIPQDPGQAGKTQVAYLTAALAGYKVHSSPESGDKETRAELFAAQVNVGNVSMVRGDWNGPLKEQMRNFPNGKFKDMIDAGSRAFAWHVGGFNINIADAALDEIAEASLADVATEMEYDV